MTLNVFAGLLDQLSRIKELHLQGLGEPLLNPEFFDMVRLAASHGISVTTSSNLSVLHKDQAKECLESGLSCIHVSIDGATAATHERMRVGGSFGAVLDHLDLLFRTKKAAGGELPHLRMTTVLTRMNLHEIPLLIDLAARYEMEEVFLQGLCHGLGDYDLPAAYQSLRLRMREQDYVQELPERIDACFEEAFDRARKLNIRIRLPRYPRSLDDVREVCDWPMNGIYITFRGHVTPCCMIPTSDRMMMGDATTTPIDDIWNNEKYQNFRRRLTSEYPPEMCCECAIRLGTF